MATQFLIGVFPASCIQTCNCFRSRNSDLEFGQRGCTNHCNRVHRWRSLCGLDITRLTFPTRPHWHFIELVSFQNFHFIFRSSYNRLLFTLPSRLSGFCAYLDSDKWNTYLSLPHCFVKDFYSFSIYTDVLRWICTYTCFWQAWLLWVLRPECSDVLELTHDYTEISVRITGTQLEMFISVVKAVTCTEVSPTCKLKLSIVDVTEFHWQPKWELESLGWIRKLVTTRDSWSHFDYHWRRKISPINLYN